MLKKVKHNRSDEGNTEVVCVFTHHRHELLNHQRAVLANILLTLQREEERRQDHYKKKRKKKERKTNHTHFHSHQASRRNNRPLLLNHQLDLTISLQSKSTPADRDENNEVAV